MTFDHRLGFDLVDAEILFFSSDHLKGACCCYSLSLANSFILKGLPEDFKGEKNSDHVRIEKDGFFSPAQP